MTKDTENITNKRSKLNRPIIIVPMKVKKETFDTNMLNKIFFENEKIL